MTTNRETRPWPTLPYPEWSDTIETLHLWIQIVGKIRMRYSPWLNHSWSVALYVSTEGLRTSLIPYGDDGVELAFDFIEDELTIHTSTGQRREIRLVDRTVADFYANVLGAMRSVDMPVRINVMPNEIPDAIPFDEDTVHHTYDPDDARSLWHALLRANRVMTEFRAGFRGKASPVHFFWGSFDLATTRFSGRTAPPHPGGLPHFPVDVAREAYSHEVTSVGFWPGSAAAPTPIFYAYAYPTPGGFAETTMPDGATWVADLGEFALEYDTVRCADDPDGTLLRFFESTHAAAADLAHWDRAALECAGSAGPDWWVTHHAPVEARDRRAG